MDAEPVQFINALGLAVLGIAAILMLVLPRRWALVPIIGICCYMTMGERLLIFNLNFTMIRLLALVGWIRIIARGEFRPIKLNSIDKALLLWSFVALFVHTIQGFAAGDPLGYFKYKLGIGYDAVLMYFLFRYLVCDLDDIKRTFKIVAVMIIPLAIFMALEKITGRNMFAVFGGVLYITRVRDGILRCMGPFAHPILAGSFGGTIIPLVVSNWWQRGGGKFFAIIGFIAAAVICITTGSSGPAFAMIGGIIGFCFWRFRRYTRVARWAVALGVIALELAMKDHVWKLMARVSLFKGSTGDHRAMLIEQFYRHFSVWWLYGVDRHVAGGWHVNMSDIANQYLWEGVCGGVWEIAAFILIIVRCFRGVGKTVATMADAPFVDRISVWCLGVTLFAHTVNFIAISYYDQNAIMWYLLLSMISTATVVGVRHQQLVTPAKVHVAEAEAAQSAVATGVSGVVI